MYASLIAVCVAGIGLAACSTLPGSGPTTSEVMKQATEKRRQFDIVEIDGRVIATLASLPTLSLFNRFESYGKPQGAAIGLGDEISIAIWQGSEGKEGGAEGLYEPITIPVQIVGEDGAISVPFAGRVAVVGRTPQKIQATIEQRLAQQFIQPQAVVTVTKSVSNSVTVSGEQVTGARVRLSVGGDRLLDVIATAGGSKSPIYETSVRLSRNGQTVTIPMPTLVSDPKEDIYVWPGDIITLLHRPNEFSAFGATNNNNQVPFGSEKLDLAQAIAKAGGLSDLRADPEGVFLFRFESPMVVDSLGLPRLALDPGGNTPVLYHLDLRRADGYFLAKRFAVANEDLIYVANAPLTELQKFFTLIGTISGPVIGGVVVSHSVSH